MSDMEDEVDITQTEKYKKIFNELFKETAQEIAREYRERQQKIEEQRQAEIKAENTPIEVGQFTEAERHSLFGCEPVSEPQYAEITTQQILNTIKGLLAEAKKEIYALQEILETIQEIIGKDSREARKIKLQIYDINHDCNLKVDLLWKKIEQ